MMPLHGGQPLPIGKYKGQKVADIAKIDANYLAWVQVNTMYDIVDFEALTGFPKPEKVYQPQSNQQNYQQPTQQHTQPAAPATPNLQRSPVYVEQVRNTSVADLSNWTEGDMLYMVNLIRTAFKSKFNKSLLDTIVVSKIVLGDKPEEEDRPPASPPPPDLHSNHHEITDDDDDQDLPF